MTLTKTEAATLVASLEAMLKVLKPKASTKVSAAVVPFRASRSNVTVQQNRVLSRNADVARGFSRRGIKLAFDPTSGRFVNVKPYRLWLQSGRQVRKGEHGVRGFFHISQTEALAS